MSWSAAVEFALDAAKRGELERRARRRKTSRGDALRAEIVLLGAAGMTKALATWPSLVGMVGLGKAGKMTPEPATYPGYRFPAEIISHAVWLYQPVDEVGVQSNGSAWMLTTRTAV